MESHEFKELMENLANEFTAKVSEHLASREVGVKLTDFHLSFTPHFQIEHGDQHNLSCRLNAQGQVVCE